MLFLKSTPFNRSPIQVATWRSSPADVIQANTPSAPKENMDGILVEEGSREEAASAGASKGLGGSP